MGFKYNNCLLMLPRLFNSQLVSFISYVPYLPFFRLYSSLLFLSFFCLFSLMDDSNASIKLTLLLFFSRLGYTDIVQVTLRILLRKPNHTKPTFNLNQPTCIHIPVVSSFQLFQWCLLCVLSYVSANRFFFRSNFDLWPWFLYRRSRKQVY
ncbi:hypothetical protein C8Q75DRAFT_526268 [Abortiporus biennis]|nr:hypothetical protein C8Q75DRAFT_526268 [Abortiporus biennis]